jgi:tetratricopeptide (TPR) repeat protein
MADPEARQKAEDHYYAALDLVSEGEHERAVPEYEKSLEADPTFTEAMHGLARALQDLGRLDEAIVVAKRISEIDPDDVLAYTSLSVLYQKKGMIPEAEAEGAKARVLGWKQQLKKGSRWSPVVGRRLLCKASSFISSRPTTNGQRLEFVLLHQMPE